MNQDGSHADSQRLGKPSMTPVVRTVEMPETMNDMRADKMNPNSTGANLGEIIVVSFLGFLKRY